jgi:hypothetical protein
MDDKEISAGRGECIVAFKGMATPGNLSLQVLVATEFCRERGWDNCQTALGMTMNRTMRPDIK